MRRSGENQLLGEGRSGTERVKVAMQVPRDANISEWKEETRTPTPVTEEAVEERREGVGQLWSREEMEKDWRRRTGSP